MYQLSLVWNVLYVNNHISNMSHKAKGLGRIHCRNKKRIVIARPLPSSEKQCLQYPARSQK